MLVIGIHRPKIIALCGQESIHVQKSVSDMKRVTAALMVTAPGDWLPTLTPSSSRAHRMAIITKNERKKFDSLSSWMYKVCIVQ